MIIDHNSPVPLYYQLREYFRQEILSEKLKFGDELPSESQLCSQYDLSRITVKQAYDGLVADGLIVRKRGKGSFVNYKSIGYTLLNTPNLYIQLDTETIVQKASVISAEYKKCNNVVASALGIKEGTEVCYFKRVRYIDDSPTIIQTVYIAPGYEKDILSEDLTAISFHEYINQHNNIVMDVFNIDVFAIILDNFEKELLEIKCSSPQSGFFFNTVYYANKTPIIYNERIFRGDQIKLALDFQVTNEGMNIKNFSVTNNN